MIEWRRWIPAIRARIGAIVRPERAEADLHDELTFHVAMQTRANVERGMSPDAARVDAYRQLGRSARIHEEIHEMRAVPVFDPLWRDAKYAARLLRKNPTFALIAVLTLALGTGANAAIFEVVNALRLRPLPVEKPAELVSIGIDQHGKGRVGRGFPGGFFSAPLWQQIRGEQQAFSSLIAWGADRWDLSPQGEVAWAQGLYVSGSFFDALGIRAQLGRLFADADDQRGCRSPGAVLSHRFWQSRYGGNAAIVGQTITLDRQRFDVIGVAPPGFFGVSVGRSFDVALPLCAEPIMRGQLAATERRDAWWLDIMGRLKPDWPIERAGAHLGAISHGVFAATLPPSYKTEWANNYAAFTLTASPAETGVSFLRSLVAAPLSLLLGATALVLLLTCANLANLMLARGSARAREIGVRLALGASRRRLVQQMVCESALLACFGALGGLLLARWMSHALIALLDTGSFRIYVDLTPDWRVFAFVIGIALVSCVLFGLTPALRTTRRDPAMTLQPSRLSSDGHDAASLRRGLVVVQLALSIVLVVGAVLFVRTFTKLAAVDLGFDPGAIVASVDLRHAAVQPQARVQAFATIVERLQRVPGVRQAAEAMIVPLSGSGWNSQIVKAGAVQDGDVYFNEVGANYFRTMQTPILGGRAFDERDRPGRPLSAVVSEAFARRYFPGTDPIGRSFQMDVPRDPKPTFQIVGLAGNAKYLGMREERGMAGARFSATESIGLYLPVVYLALSQNPTPPADYRIVVRADARGEALTRALTAAITDAVPGAAVSYDEVTTYLGNALVRERLVASLTGLFGLLSMLIAALGLYGIVAYSVSRRTVEIGIRMALGADRGDVIRLILSETGTLLASGVVLGTLLAMVASKFASSLVYGVRPLDPISFVTGTAALTAVSLLAAWIPARRASRLLPTVALRE